MKKYLEHVGWHDVEGLLFTIMKIINHSKGNIVQKIGINCSNWYSDWLGLNMYVKVNFGIKFMYLILLLIYSIEKVGG